MLVSYDWQFRSKKETDRLHRLNKPVRQAPTHNDLPSVDSHDEGSDSWSSGIEDALSEGLDENEDNLSDDSGFSSDDSKSDAEMSYERLPRKRGPSWEPPKETSVRRLPIKTADGRVHQTGGKLAAVNVYTASTEESESDDEESLEDEPPITREDISTGARFGRPAVVDIVGNKSRKARIQGAKEQIAGICQEVVADPESSVSIPSLQSNGFSRLP